MNKVIITSILTLLTPALWSCSDSNDTPEPVATEVTITVSPSSLSSGYDATNLEVTVASTADWSIKSEDDWCITTPTGGVKNLETKVTVKISANSGSSSRTTNLIVTSSGKTATIPVTQSARPTLNVSSASVSFGAQASSTTITVEANDNWTATSDADWCKVSPASGDPETSTLTISTDTNSSKESREATVTVTSGDLYKTIKVDQYTDEITAPEGYSLVWHDEFNEGIVPSSDWTIENWAAGHVNNELQTYTSKEVDGKRTLEIIDGILYINCFKGTDGKIYSGRMNARPETGWLYGYFEARIWLPKGKGTWPAFWMMPSNVDWNTNPWPYCGEIDIMEEVGVDPNYVSSSLHTGNYNHTKGTQKTHSMYCAGAEEGFHIYAVEWTEDQITTYVDGKVQLSATKASMGQDHDSWPFHYAFYPILNLAWGGDWGGYNGVDESALPVSMKVDYVRIFQKN